MSISVSKLTKRYGKQLALDEVTFSIPSQQVVGFLGPNGAGKSTLMKIITGYLPQTSGEAQVCGFDVIDQALEVKKCIGYLPENNPLYLEMYIREYLAFIAGLHHIKNKVMRVKEMIDLTGLGPEQHKKIGQLSKGYRQRVGLAQALIHDPKVLILDEPTSGLDPIQLVEIRALIKNIGTEKTVILSTHIMQEVSAVCQRVIIIHKGKIKADDLTENLGKHLKARDILFVEFDKAADEMKMKEIAGVLHIEKVSPVQFRIDCESNVDIRKELFNYAVFNGLTVHTLKKEEQGLEDIFQEITKL